MLRISGLKLSLDDEKEKLEQLIHKKLRLKSKDIIKWYIYKQSLDARRKKPFFVYTVDVEVKNEEYLISKVNDPSVSYSPDLSYQYVNKGSEKLKDPPVIVGTGPAGLFAALLLAEMGYRPVLIERGDDIEKRGERVLDFWQKGLLDEHSNVQFGEGGAGTFSDGKLTTLIKDKRCRKILKDFVLAGAPEEILYSYKPHIGTDVLRGVVKKIRCRIESLGGTVLFRKCLTDLEIESGAIKGIIVNNKERISCQALALAIGHSARDTFELLYQRQVKMIPKAFSIGVRIEHSQEAIDLAQYKEYAGHPKLGPAEYKLAYHSNMGRSAYTFCMCPGGVVVAAASQQGHLVTNGMSYHARKGVNANSALLVGVTPDDYCINTDKTLYPLSGVEFQRKWEKLAFDASSGGDYKAPVQLVGDFLNNRETKKIGHVHPTYTRGVVLSDISRYLPDYVTNTMREAILAFDGKLKGFAREDAVLTGVETRSSSPVRILRDDNYQASISGIYPAGEGAGYAGGIVSAAVDGLRVAEAIVQRFKPIKENKL